MKAFLPKTEIVAESENARPLVSGGDVIFRHGRAGWRRRFVQFPIY